MNFNSDNEYGVHPGIMESLAHINKGTSSSYSSDSFSEESEERLRVLFECNLRSFLVTTGTAANGLALSAITPPFGAILCQSDAHIAVDECNSPEMFTGGAKIIGLKGSLGKINSNDVRIALKGFTRGEHGPKAAAVSITNANEFGGVYSSEEIRAISDVIRPSGIKLHVDGARFANAIVYENVSPADLAWRAGVDVLSFGATKNGAMLLEVVIFFDLELAENFEYRRMRAGQLVSKSRYLGAQLLAYLKNDLWLVNARNANRLAQRLVTGLRTVPGIRIYNEVQANEVFVVMSKATMHNLSSLGVRFSLWPTTSEVEPSNADAVLVRFVCSFATPPADVDRLIELFDHRNSIGVDEAWCV